MLIYPRPSEFCGKCKEDKNCLCECHNIDLINSKHYEIHVDDQEFKVKEIPDLDHFRF